VDLPKYRLFILGAGFSRAAGFPLGPELLAAVRARVRSEFQQFDWEGPLESEIEEWSKLYPNSSLNLESVLAYSQRKHFLGLIGSDEYFAHGSRSVVAARRAIQEILTAALPRTSIPLLYRNFASRLTPNDTILTFNYDTLLESALDAIGKPYSLTPEWWLDDDLTIEKPAQYVDLIKLHGSIDWYDRRYHDDSRIYHAGSTVEIPDNDPLFSPAAKIPTESLARGPVTRGLGIELLTRVFRVPRHESYFPFDPSGVTAVPFLLPPAYDKLLGHDPIRDLWRDLHRVIPQFSTVAIVGYSLPTYDGHAYEALGHAFIRYQSGMERTTLGHRRSQIQIVTCNDSGDGALVTAPFLRPELTRVWHRGFTQESLDWLDWGVD
jgi:hypothetical protein